FSGYSAKNKKCTGDQIPPEECSICVKKGHKFHLGQHCMTAQLSVELVQRRVAKRGLVIKGGKSSGAQVVK
ncbi:unnamed protein product, partial [Staurois parvus]